MAIQLSSELLDGCVLGLLMHDDYYGYALTQKVQESVSVSESTMYPVLRRLKKNQLLTTYDEPYQGRNRRYYQITAEGKRQFSVIQSEWRDFKIGIDKMLGDEAGHE
ncbi:PadR family transcriptional regulator [Lentilactobacillus hilgardii]|uniref:Transcriptional regulator, PadR family n=1 Tax=Lentilactobacillus hilgardii (strain ATCC 8290 / DSM 20176 / CCUG 30140 / JCM 1155 / KCTC 3500 / NBRC 15886 / NCIMB 8040 / NRRL B-1843 / 9) TaxID=1423757 RepID=C0XHH1_LENH9|nr:PadR family transcriptional regulator [Lentilactobacillus hilgardii]EEI19158.1 transcriptional regulator, PadR family [Lentilactobacillus buchneri ATCC 11577]EEI25103.1 transcriptional regulator, PadR family [Lentilactobacillus hilgardii DSM 20176 = ATCC 8290]KRK59398.1 transcriptional regulator [Lentilactobacillus hilgardii DSM 20176 = ATCC 8290]MCP9331970.1 PadR family transcriptional regulator [Lentilactobacillus hilgardii]MCP9348556.1 PadR family transcriptional regulator [Lentilactobac